MKKSISSSKSIIADSSSLILLQKVKLLCTLVRVYDLFVAGAVYGELIAGGKNGSQEFKTILKDKVIYHKIHTVSRTMGAGESETIELYKEGFGDFVLLDDKQAALACKRSDIPFINSLLLPRVLCNAGILEEKECSRAMLQLFNCGYYSEAVMEKAKKLANEDLAKFLPDASV